MRSVITIAKSYGAAYDESLANSDEFEQTSMAHTLTPQRRSQRSPLPPTDASGHTPVPTDFPDALSHTWK
jgi:hypothetical protein